MKKLVSLGVVSAMLSCLAFTSFAATDASSTNVTKIFALWNDKNTLGKTEKASGFSAGTNGELTSRASGTNVNGITMNDSYYFLEGNNTDSVRLIFGSSSTTLVANSTGAGKGSNYRGITPLKASTSDLTYTKNSTFTSSAISVSKGTYSVNVGSGEYSYALGFEIKFNNKSKNEAYAMYDLGVAGKTFKVIVHSTSNDPTDTSFADNEPDENGIIPFGGTDAKFANGTVIYSPTLRAMYEKGATYGIHMKNGVSLIVSKVMKATPDAGNLTLNYNIGKDAIIMDRYGSVAGGNPLSLDIVSGFVNEKIKYNIDLSNTEVLKTITDAQSDRWSDGKPVYVYVVNKTTLETAANASASDGIINNEKMIVGKIADGKVVFDIPAKYFDNTKEKLMVSLNQLDIANLPAVAGVSVETSAANEITAPIISDMEVSAPATSIGMGGISAISNPQEISATTTVPNTGLKDNLIMAAAIVVATISSIGCVIYKRQKENA